MANDLMVSASAAFTPAQLQIIHNAKDDGNIYANVNAVIGAPHLFGADGKPTTNWYETQAYKDSQVQAAKDKELLKTYEKWGLEGDLKSNNPAYQARGLARQKAFDENSRTEAAREVAAANRDLQRQELDIRREDLGLRDRAQVIADAQLLAQRQHLRLRPAPEHGVLGLGGDQLDAEVLREGVAGAFATVEEAEADARLNGCTSFERRVVAL